MPKMATWDAQVSPASADGPPGPTVWRPNKGHCRSSSSNFSAACAGETSTWGELDALADASNDGESHNMRAFFMLVQRCFLTWINTAVNQVHKLQISSSIQGPAC
jgi:hypothetical protein